MSDDSEDRPRRSHEPRLRRVARRLFRNLDRELHSEDEPEASEPADESEHRWGDGAKAETWALLSALMETGDKAKTEIVRMLAREVRSYLEALDLHKDLHHLITHYSLEVHASVHLKPLGDDPPAPRADVALRPRGEPTAPPESDAG